MNELELNERIEGLEKKKKGLERNRTMCVLLAGFLGYSAWTSIKQGTPPTWFYFAMGAIILGVVAVGLFGHKTIKETNAAIAELQKELTKLQAEREEDEDADEQENETQ